MNYLKLLFLFLISVLSQNITSAQDWFSFQSQQQINDLIESNNELYTATDAGIVVINKSTLSKTIFNKANSNLSHNKIKSITQTTNGDIWIGTHNAMLSRFDGANFQEATFPNNINYDSTSTELFDFKIAPNGDLWIGTSDGVFHKQAQNWFHYDQEELGSSFFEAWDIAINDLGEVFIASLDVHKFKDGVWSNLSTNTTLSGYLDADLFFSTSGDLYVSGDLDQIGRFDGVQWQEYDIDFNGSEVLKFTEDVNGNIYFNSRRNGIFKLVNDTWTQQTDAQTEAFDNKTNYFYIDEQNNSWLNSNIHLSVNDNGNIQSTLISQHSLETNSIRSIHNGDNNKFYFITNSENNISVLASNGSWSFLPKPTSAMPFEFFNDILALADDDIWLASNNGLYHYDGSEWTFNDLNACQALEVDSQGKIYIRSSDRIYIIDNDIFSEYNTSNSSLSNLIISGFGLDANDDLWIASFDWDGDKAIQKVSSNGSWTTYDENDLPALSRPVGKFHFDSAGNVWVTNDQIGALQFDGTTWTNPIVANADLITNTDVSSISIDATGKIYFAHQYGLTSLFNGAWENLLIEDVPNVATSSNSHISFDNAGSLWWANSRHGAFAFSSTNLLPVSLINFEVNARPKNSVKLDWATASEKNNAYFSIEHSTDGNRFQEIAKLNGSGTSSTIQNYTYLHDDLENGWHYYRLKQVDFDGNYEYTVIKNARIDHAEHDIVLMPNPSSGAISIQMASALDKDMNLQILNTQGQIILSSILQNGEQYLNLDITEFPNGVYYLKVLQGNNLIVKKIIKQ